MEFTIGGPTTLGTQLVTTQEQSVVADGEPAGGQWEESKTVGEGTTSQIMVGDK